jgi:hypothetical protein
MAKTDDQGQVAEVLGVLTSPDADARLRGIIQSYLMQGHSRRAAIDVLEAARGELSDAQEDEDELILDYIAILSGWASRTAQRNLIPKPCKLPSSAAVPG